MEAFVLIVCQAFMSKSLKAYTESLEQFLSQRKFEV